MKISPIDAAIIIAYILFALGLGLHYSKRAGSNIGEFFVSGRNLPWWLAGTSMVATTFAADTPLAVTGLVVKDGIAGNWLWWNMVLSGMLATFLFSRLWRRAEILTDVELTELRYSGKSASLLRGFRALYIGLPINCITMGWVILAMQKIIGLTFDLRGHDFLADSDCFGLHADCGDILCAFWFLGRGDDGHRSILHGDDWLDCPSGYRRNQDWRDWRTENEARRGARSRSYYPEFRAGFQRR